MFDPEKAERLKFARIHEIVREDQQRAYERDGEDLRFVLASDYDQLLALYKKQEGALEWMRRSLMQKLTFRRALALVPCLLKWK